MALKSNNNLQYNSQEQPIVKMAYNSQQQPTTKYPIIKQNILWYNNQ